MTLGRKLGVWLLLAVAVWQVSLTDSTKLMKSYNFFGPNAGPVPRKQSDQARQLLYIMAGSTAFGVLLRRSK